MYAAAARRWRRPASSNSRKFASSQALTGDSATVPFPLNPSQPATRACDTHDSGTLSIAAGTRRPAPRTRLRR